MICTITYTAAALGLLLCCHVACAAAAAAYLGVSWEEALEICRLLLVCLVRGCLQWCCPDEVSSMPAHRSVPCRHFGRRTSMMLQRSQQKAARHYELWKRLQEAMPPTHLALDICLSRLPSAALASDNNTGRPGADTSITTTCRTGAHAYMLRHRV